MAKAYVKIKGTKKLSADLKKRFNGFLKDETEMKRVATIINSEWKRDLAKTETQTKRIKPSTVERRDKLISYGNKPSKYYGKYKSNITFTGQLTSRGLKLVNKGLGRFLMEAVGLHKGYKNKKGKRTGKIEMSELAGHLTNKGWRVFFYPKSATSRIVKNLRRYIRKNKSS